MFFFVLAAHLPHLLTVFITQFLKQGARLFRRDFAVRQHLVDFVEVGLVLCVHFWFWFLFFVRLHWNVGNVGDEDGVLRVRNRDGMRRVGKPKQVGERQQVDQAPHLLCDVIQTVKRIFGEGRIVLELLGQNLNLGRIAPHDVSHRDAAFQRLQRHVDLRVIVAHTEQELRRMALLCGHFMRLQLALALAFNVSIRVVKDVFVILAGNPVDLFQGLQRARKFAHVDLGQWSCKFRIVVLVNLDQ